MARNTTPSTAASAHESDTLSDPAEELAVAAESADLQVHHLWLRCLEQTRRAQARLAREFTEDMFDTARKLVLSHEPKERLDTQAEWMRKCVAHGAQAQSDALAAWADLQSAWSKDLQANARMLPWLCMLAPHAVASPNGHLASTAPWQDPWSTAWHQAASALLPVLTRPLASAQAA